MKNVRLLLVLLLIVNCTTDLSDNSEISASINPQTQNCVDDLPTIRITNNGVHSFDFVIYDFDDNYNLLHTQSVTIAANSNWIELSSTSVIIVASNAFDYGQKIHLDLEPCDTIELVIDATDTFIEL